MVTVWFSYEDSDKHVLHALVRFPIGRCTHALLNINNPNLESRSFSTSVVMLKVENPLAFAVASYLPMETNQWLYKQGTNKATEGQIVVKSTILVQMRRQLHKLGNCCTHKATAVQFTISVQIRRQLHKQGDDCTNKETAVLFTISVQIRRLRHKQGGGCTPGLSAGPCTASASHRLSAPLLCP